MKYLFPPIFAIIIILWWFIGLALTEGFWETTLGIFFPPYPMYLAVAEILLPLLGL